MEVKIIKGYEQPYINDAFLVRDEVFTKEQGFPAEIDIDEYDPLSFHAIIYQNNVPVGTGRLIPTADNADTAKIGRVAIRKQCRGSGLGLLVMKALMETAQKEGFNQVALSSQMHAQPFYQKLGFIPEGQTYLEDGMEHIFMTYRFSQ